MQARLIVGGSGRGERIGLALMPEHGAETVGREGLCRRLQLQIAL